MLLTTERELENINLEINKHYDIIRTLKKRKNKIYCSKYYKINKKNILEKIKIRKYKKKNIPKGLTIKKEARLIVF
tara:strand:- start:4488 stop:4715 length:228 start_codon:yes stop_codon:yes gene_type:complete